MNFPKPVMTKQELISMGFGERMLEDVYFKKGYPYAFKETGTRTCQIKYDTELLGNYIRQINERRR